MLGRTTDQVRRALPTIENYSLLCELQRDMSGFDRLVQPDRKLLRQGCLLKHSRRGLQQRMFFLVRRARAVDVTSYFITYILKVYVNIIYIVHGCPVVRHQVAAEPDVPGAGPRGGAVDANGELGAQRVRHIRRAARDYGERWHDGRENVVARRAGQGGRGHQGHTTYSVGRRIVAQLQ